MNREVLTAMNETLRHRGPDDSGMLVSGPVGLAMRRLSIIDLQGGRQPIANEQGTVHVIQNGEIYNFPSLRQRLAQQGHLFQTRSDTEAIVHAYEAYGQDFVTHLRGMFAIAVWDEPQRRLTLVRDRAGIKPLFYYRDGTRFIFASEMKSILRHPDVAKRIDPQALDAYFTSRFVPAPRTIFENIFKLPPGHRLVVDDSGVQVEKYWELHYRIQSGKQEADWVEAFREKFTEAVRIRLLSDVPLGAMLSGGIDSSAIVAVMSRLSDRPVQTFSIGFSGNVGPFDETADARRVSTLFGTEHHELIVRPDIRELAPRMAEFFDEPFGNSSAIPNYYVAKMARRHVTVALNGLGGDEVAVGYPRHLGLQAAQYYRKIPRFVREEVLPGLVGMLPDSRSGSVFSERLKRFVSGSNAPLYRSYLNYMTYLQLREKEALYTPDLLANINGYVDHLVHEHFHLHPDLDIVNRALFVDLKFDLPDNLLTLTDRMSMAHSLEVRVPFLDHELLEFMAAIPPAYKRRGWTTKYFLKKALAGILPEDILFKKKQGFTIPLALWFRTELRSFVEAVLSRERVERTGFLRYPAVRDMLTAHFRSKENYHCQIWTLMMFVLWYEANFG